MSKQKPVKTRKPVKAGNRTKSRKPRNQHKRIKFRKTGPRTSKDLGRGSKRRKTAVSRTRVKKPKIIQRRFAPRLLLEDKLGRLVFRIATRGEGFNENSLVFMRCTAWFKLSNCTAIGTEDKTWEAELIKLEQKL